MRYVLLSLLLFSTTANAQLTEKQLKEIHDNTAKIESSSVELNKSINATMHNIDSMNQVQFNKQNERNLNAFMAERAEQERKAKRGAYVRIAFGVLLLVVLIIGLKRKKKTTVE